MRKKFTWLTIWFAISVLLTVSHMVPEHNTYSLVHSIEGEDYILDYNLTLEDCLKLINTGSSCEAE